MASPHHPPLPNKRLPSSWRAAFWGVVGLPRKQKIGVKKRVKKYVELERTADNWVNFLGDLKPWRNKPERFAEKFAIKIHWEIRQDFSWNSPGKTLKFTPKKSALQSLGIKSSQNWLFRPPANPRHSPDQVPVWQWRQPITKVLEGKYLEMLWEVLGNRGARRGAPRGC